MGKRTTKAIDERVQPPNAMKVCTGSGAIVVETVASTTTISEDLEKESNRTRSSKPTRQTVVEIKALVVKK